MSAPNPIRELRETLGVTQSEAAKAAGLHRPTLSLFENGHMGADGETTEKIKGAIIQVASDKALATIQTLLVMEAAQ